MKREDYFKYRVHNGDIYVLPEEVFDELFDELLNLQSENKQLRGAITKTFEIINYEYNFYDDIIEMKNDIWDILKEVIS